MSSFTERGRWDVVISNHAGICDEKKSGGTTDSFFLSSTPGRKIAMNLTDSSSHSEQGGKDEVMR